MLVEPIVVVMNEDVMPWMLDQMMDFLLDETEIAHNVNEVIQDSVELSR